MATDTGHVLDAFISTWDREVETTKRVLENLPEGKDDWKPVETARSLRDLAWIFITEEQVIERLAKGDAKAAVPPSPPEGPLSGVVKKYDAAHRSARAAVQAAGGKRLDATISFPVGPGQMGAVPVAQAYWLFLHDNIHHRGQMSVYLRLLGAKVPSIYGGSLDEPWR
jgi:uncharacterized damage-inducible protein DinB